MRSFLALALISVPLLAETREPVKRLAESAEVFS